MKEKQTKQPGILMGYSVGKLSVVEATEQRREGYVVWRCACECGGEIFLDTRTLRRGNIVDCGCSTKVKPGQKDLTGIRYGHLVCMEPMEHRSKYGGMIWRCKCDCGNECLAATAQLRSGNKKSCGCIWRPPLKDYEGKKFGLLTVIEYAGKEKGMHRWRCKCSCGKETVVGQTQLQNGNTKSCGCLRKNATKSLKLVDGSSVSIIETSRRKTVRTNRSGYTGVYWNKKTKKWIAQITFRRKVYYLGSYEKIEDAVSARKEGEKMHTDFLEQYYSKKQD